MLIVGIQDLFKFGAEKNMCRVVRTVEARNVRNQRAHGKAMQTCFFKCLASSSGFNRLVIVNPATGNFPC